MKYYHITDNTIAERLLIITQKNEVKQLYIKNTKSGPFLSLKDYYISIHTSTSHMLLDDFCLDIWKGWNVTEITKEDAILLLI